MTSILGALTGCPDHDMQNRGYKILYSRSIWGHLPSTVCSRSMAYYIKRAWTHGNEHFNKLNTCWGSSPTPFFFKEYLRDWRYNYAKSDLGSSYHRAPTNETKRPKMTKLMHDDCPSSMSIVLQLKQLNQD